MALVQQDLRGNVLGRSANGVGAFLDNLCKAEIDQFQIAVSRDHYVLRLQIAIDHVFRLEVFEYSDYLGTVEFSLVRVEVSNSAMVSEKITALEQLCNEVNIPVILHESIVIELEELIENTYDERVL